MVCIAVSQVTGLAVHHSKPDAKPTFRKTKPVPLAVLPTVSLEINRLINESVMTAAYYSDFATAIVIVQKMDDSMWM
ncbi:hypothetical protein B9Z55_025328 [Caenorhabditis nigoni]|uniref:Reverse transcriptase domain-containing protein n=1 Tax=Caenorhabditis nigoni TaxID=1611254 RepID=A0A2G5SYJ6_9PELO|nr:hypothetical protein B9Z55_025328 [Caenorhabditis nigoni]